MTLEEMLQMERKRKKKQKYDDEEHRIGTSHTMLLRKVVQFEVSEVKRPVVCCAERRKT